MRFYIVHVNGDSEHRCESDVEVADVATSHHAVVSAPVVHHFVSTGKSALAGEDGREPSGGPGGIGALVECFMYVFWKLDGVAFRDLKGRT